MHRLTLFKRQIRVIATSTMQNDTLTTPRQHQEQQAHQPASCASEYRAFELALNDGRIAKSAR
ncbi:MAG TPA: hypothetical protein VFU82_06020 [Gammaproteobacteria bacterium]|nr:hypothetical protein [Gammaproteobacteria bacterium]